ncbi:SusC/RagA family TonB-linked outer membrane protein (plasmid) [Hymenobacter sp. NBH84]|uniref:SusC/RagA family TonB-linked outer membrane protein n=1 Tax=Hymenobacter sp. NBH84 TaxID=2596915 RepID=UPI0016281098|nr:SusC/RagA family TonB-linked outer membrane protein [Hymenobacter sp. NBH84]QNE41954.1 SusC/RagA family TonB-linked outer membrane protein [Hymenobacter sp. NBH84]
MRNQFTKGLLLFMLLSLFVSTAFAQQSRTITGTVKDEKGVPVPFATVQVKGTTNGGTTNDDGAFSVTLQNDGSVLVISSIGYKSKEVSVPMGGSNTINVVLGSNANELGEVVVTALGIERERKSLGYAVQEVAGQTLVEAREPNVVNALSGKVAGLQVIRSSNGPAGSSKIILRGNNSLTGDNQPLIVVDGIPISNATGAVNNDYFNPSLDMGNGLSDINPEDIASISVLKGPAAAALYGTRAGNGAILITTKSGRPQKGLGITISSTVGLETMFTHPKLQDAFGQGSNNIYDNRANTSWGPKADGQQVTGWNDEQTPLQTYDNIGNYFRDGIRSNQSVSLQQQYKSTALYTSFNRLDDQSIIPGTKLTRTNLMARAITNFGAADRWTIDTKVQYSQSKADNRPLVGANQSNSYSTLYMLPRSLDIRDFKSAVNEAGQMLWYGGSNQVSPYWNNKYNLNQDVRDRFIMNASLKYAFTDWLSAEVRAGADKYYTNSENKLYDGSPIAAGGRYSLGKQDFTETNYSALVTAKQDNVVGKLGGVAILGTNLMAQQFSDLNSSSGNLKVPNLFSLNNGVGNPTVGQRFYERRINSIYGSAQLNWDGYLFLDVTGRTDWSSTLSKVNNPFFYPAVSVSYVFTDMMERMGSTLPGWLSFGKLRASYAEVGNDLSPYQLYNIYTINKDPNGNTTAGRNGTLYDQNVRNERIKSYEAGLEMRFLKDRLGFDVAVYKSNATNQLISLPLDPLSGYSYRIINAGNIQNKGIEARVNGAIIQNPTGLNWDIMANFSRNNNTVESLTGDVLTYPLGGFDDVRVVATAGGRYGDIYGSKFLRVDDANSPYNGQLLLNAAGLPQRGEQNVKLGNQQAKGLLGVTNTVTYKGIGLSFLVDARFGGKIFSSTLASMQENGTSSVTAPGGERQEFVVDGAVAGTNSGSYEKNAVPVTQQLYWTAVAGVGNLGITEANLYDASNVRLRNLQLNYALPTTLLAKTPLQRVNVGVTCTNLWLIKSHLNGLDPESVYATGTNATGFENASPPTTRAYLFNVVLGF